jgi:putative flippase GtrA
MLHTQANRLALVIPAYRPPDRLLDLARQLSPSFARIVIVDDGSGAEFREVFARAAELPRVEVLRHTANLGRGAAIKTGLNHALASLPGLIGVVTAEPGCQPADIERVAQSLLAHPESLVQPAADSALHALIGRDSQTGLRGIPTGLAPRILQIAANGPEFDLELQMTARRSGVSVVEEPVGVARSRFNPLLESTKLYFLLPRFAAVALATALLDHLIFNQALHRGWPRLWSMALGWIAGVAFNYPLVRGAVFRSRERHQRVLPKYLLLALANAAVAYAGISAKPLVEPLLFLINFAVQRLFIFTGLPDRGRKRAFPLTPVVTAVFLGSLALEAHGFLTAHLFSQDIWDPIGVKRFLKYIGMFVAIAFPLLMMVPWTFAALIVSLTAVGTAFAIGPLALVAVAFYLISSCTVGSRLLGRKHGDSPESQIFSTLLGAAVWICVMTLAARIPVNFPAVWAALLAAPVLLDWRGAWRRLGRWWQLLCGAELRGYADRIAFAAVVFVLLAHWFVALMPESSADGLAMHLAVPMNLAANHAMTYQPSRLLWAVMPMGADFSYAIVYLLGGEYAAHLLDYAFLLLIEAALYFAIRRWLCRSASFWLLALFASTPLVQLVTGSLFVENVLAGMVAGMAAALWRFADSGEKRFFYLAAALGGTSMAIKFGALAFVALAVPFLAMEAARHWKSLGPRPAAACLLAGVLLVGIAAPPYAIAYLKTGNPLFPFLNDMIPTPLIPRDTRIADERFKRPLTWNTPYDLTFRTNLTYEGQNGSFGFQYLVFAPLGVAAILAARRRRDVLSSAVIALGAAAVIMRTEPNARYLYAALPLLSVPFAALLEWAYGRRWLYRGLLAFVVVCAAMNMRFMPSASYYHRDFCLRLPFSRAERDRFRAGAAPVREVIDYYNREYPHSVAMMTAESAIAGLRGEFYENHWHQIRTLLRLREVQKVAEMVKLMQSWKVEYFISPKPEIADAVKPAVLREMLERCTQPVYEQGSEYLARLLPDCRPPKQRTPVLVHRGSYDDFDPALVYRGDWTHDNHTFPEADRRTVSFTDVPDAEVEIDFEGGALTYVYTKAVNRGMASITIDGAEQGAVDLYSADTKWQSRTRFCCFAPGRHVAIVRATGKANPQSKGRFIDLDSFTVE